ncbi:MAG: hypothetical protein PUE13_02790 [Clostridiales bacterium]|nr:hypothetical protein [Clostridiales bacterium]
MYVKTIQELKREYDKYIDFEEYENNPEQYYRISNDTSLKDMIKSKLNAVLNEEHFSVQMPYVIEYLKVSQSRLLEYLTETIEINAIEQILFIYQQIDDENKINKSIFFDGDSKKSAKTTTIDRIDKRLDYKRGRISREKCISLDGEEFYMPKIIQAFRDVLLCQKLDTEINMISLFYSPLLNIFINPEKNNERYSDFELLLSHRLWDFNLKQLKKLKDIYCIIMGEKDLIKRFCCIMFLEKLYGVLNFCALLDKNSGIITEQHIIIASAAISLGFTPLHDKLYELLNEITKKSKHIFDGILNEFIFPICTICLEYIIVSLFLYTDDLMQFRDYIYNLCSESKPTIEKYLEFICSTEYAVTTHFEKGGCVLCYKNLLYGHETKISDIICFFDDPDDPDDPEPVLTKTNVKLGKEIYLYMSYISHDANVYYDHDCSDNNEDYTQIMERKRQRLRGECEFDTSKTVIDRDYLSLTFK